MKNVRIKTEQFTDMAPVIRELNAANLTREQAAAIVRRHGFYTYIGGHHIAIHGRPGPDMGPRLAIITGFGPDWD